MAGTNPKGSLRDFNYVDDAGNTWGVRLDESNTLLVNDTASEGAATATNRLPSNMKTRKVVLVDSTGNVTRTCTVLTLTKFAGINGADNFTLAATDPNSGTVVAPTRKVPEKSRNIIKNYDSGQTDGTNP